ncbi:MAG: response regulator [Desulfamplus sp.]|nr:response regulator [Desulfamplus sp.]
MHDNSPPDNHFSILIVDDEPMNIQLLGNLLKDQHYKVEFATSGKEAIDWIYSYPFDLVLLDIMMPGMSGYEVCRKIKSDKTKKHIPVIFLTAMADTKDILKGFEVGGSDYITKPFQALELLARVKVHVEIKTLRGLIPICSKCKDIRDDKGAWTRVEAYIQKHSEALFSHALCPKCMESLYGKEPWFKTKKSGSNT